MINISTVKELKKIIAAEKAEGKKVGFVPTMGYLHEGHLTLVSHARKTSDITVMSIFVNPLQFGEGEDYETYPRNFEDDFSKAEINGVDILFTPDVTEMYPDPMSTVLTVKEGADKLCGASRPGHFDGVATVVMKLFQIVKPDSAFFGMKDAQQVAVIQRMVDDFHLDVTITAVETVREPDGLAKSSRNVNLTAGEREEAPEIYRTLKEAREKALSGYFYAPAEIEKWASEQLNGRVSGEIDYVQLLTFPGLEAPQSFTGKYILACAVRYSRARLIDNITWHM